MDELKGKHIDLTLSKPDQLYRLARALASPVRLRMLQVLGQNNLNVGELAQALDIPMSTAALAVKTLEEVGLIAGNYTLLTELATSPGIFDERIFVYLATDLSACQTDPDEDEFLNVRRFPLDELICRIVRGEIQDSKTIVGLMLAREALKK